LARIARKRQLAGTTTTATRRLSFANLVGQTFQFATAAELAECVQRAVAGGPVLHTDRDVGMALDWLSGLFERRADWDAAIGHSLWSVGASADGRAAVADLLARHELAPAFTEWGERLLQDYGDSESHHPAHMVRFGAGDKPRLSAIVAALRDFVDARRRPGRELVFARADGVRFPLTGPQDLAAPVRLSVALGFSAAEGTLGDTALGWLNFEARFVPWIAHAVPALVQELIECGDRACVYIGAQFLNAAQDVQRYGDLVDRLVRHPPPWSDWPAAPDSSLFPKHWRPTVLKYWLGGHTRLGQAVDTAAYALRDARETAPRLDA
jgi:hypothetical protein